MIKKCLLVIFYLMTTLTFAQQYDYSVMGIPDSLKVNASAVVRLDETAIRVTSVKSMLILTRQIVTVLDANGLSSVDRTFYYDKSSKITNLEAIVYDTNGKEIKRIKKKDFIDHSVADGFSVFTDNRALSMDYTPTGYPFTIEVKSEIETNNTGVIRPWLPVNAYNQSLMKSEYRISYPTDMELKSKEYNFSGFDVKKIQTQASRIYVIENIPALRYEEYAPSVTKLFPFVRFGLNKFALEGTEGVADSWKDFGLWMNEKLLNDVKEIPLETQLSIKKLVEQEKDPIAKAKKIYKYVQDKTRYISVQVGIGGWKPMKAADVDRLGYGDCKALSNYTKALLEVVGIPSFYTVIYGGIQRQDVLDDLVSIQGNHAILTIPYEDKNYFMECTSQTTPFGYQGKFTDGRMALLIKPEGGELVKTDETSDVENSQKSKGSFVVDAQGDFKGEVVILSGGTQYESKYLLSRKAKEEQDKFYKNYFFNIENLKVNTLQFEDDRDNVQFKETVNVQAEHYATLSGERILFPANAFNVNRLVPQRYRSRKLPFQIERGYQDYDEIIIQLPQGYVVEGLPQNTILNTKYGDYKTEYTLQGTDKVVVIRSLLLKRGKYPKEEYEEFRKFMEITARNDNAKISLIKNK